MRLRQCQGRATMGTLTLVYSAHDSEHNDAVVLAEVLRRGPAELGKAAVTGLERHSNRTVLSDDGGSGRS